MINETYQIIALNILLFVSLAMAGASATLFWDFCIGSPHTGEVTGGRIFSSIGYWLERRYEAFEAKEDLRLVDLAKLKFKNVKSEEALEMMKRKRHKNFWKILGICPVCANPYITFSFFLVAVLLLPVLSWWVCIPTLVLSSNYLRRWMRTG